MSTFGDIANVLRRGSPVPFVSEGTASSFTSVFSRGENRERELEAMGSLGAIFSIVDGISSFGAGLGWELIRSGVRQSGDGDPVVVTSHPAIDLWAHPNDFMSRQELVEISLQHLNLVGEAWWVVVRDKRSPMPIEVWPVRPDRMEPVPSAKKFLSGYVYSSPGGEKIPLGIDDVIFIRRPNPLDPYRGMGPVQTVLADIDASKYTAEWNKNFFLNSAEPGGVIEAPEGLTDDEFKTLQKRWNEQHRGVSNAHRVAIIERGKWVPRTFTMKDMQFKELREVNAEVIRRAWRWPQALNGDSGDINRATAQAQEYIAGKWIIDPQMTRIRAGVDALTAYFAADGKPDVQWRVESAVPDDEEAENASRTSRVQAWASMVTAGADPQWAAEVCGIPMPRNGQLLRPALTAPPLGAVVSACPSCGLLHG